MGVREWKSLVETVARATGEGNKEKSEAEGKRGRGWEGLGMRAGLR